MIHSRPEEIHLERCATGKFNDSWFVANARESFVLRIAPPEDRSRMLFYEHRMMLQEPGLHELLRRKTRAPVPRIIEFRERDETLGRDFILMERLPGTPLSRQRMSAGGFERVLRQIGTCLRETHRLNSDRYGYVGAHRPMDPQPDWPSAFSVMWNLLIDDIANCDGYSAREAERMRHLLERHHGVFDRPVKASLLHMDVWAENILADPDGRLTGLIDWDRALWGDPEIEFAVLEYCGISEPAFWEGYGKEPDRDDAYQIRRIFYLLYEIQKYIVIQRRRRNNPAQADQYREQSLMLAAQLNR